jgi:ubiquinone/menaquinone biosynthesis C-methylase UbiE
MVEDFYTDYDRLIRLACPGYDHCLELIAKNIPAHAKTVLDLGSGTGNLILTILDKHPNLSITGMELQPNLIDIAYRKIRNTGRNNIRIVQGDILNFNWPETQGITSSLTIHHFDYENKKRIFEKIFKNSGFFLYFDRFKGRHEAEEEENLRYLFGFMRKNGFSEAMVEKARQDMAVNDKPLTLNEQNRLFDEVGFGYELLYLNHGFAVYSCIKKE